MGLDRDEKLELLVVVITQDDAESHLCNPNNDRALHLHGVQKVQFVLFSQIPDGVYTDRIWSSVQILLLWYQHQRLFGVFMQHSLEIANRKWVSEGGVKQVEGLAEAIIVDESSVDRKKPH